MRRIVTVSVAVVLLACGLFWGATRLTTTVAAQEPTVDRPGAFFKLYELCAANSDPLAQVQACDAYLTHTR